MESVRLVATWLLWAVGLGVHGETRGTNAVMGILRHDITMPPIGGKRLLVTLTCRLLWTEQLQVLSQQLSALKDHRLATIKRRCDQLPGFGVCKQLGGWQQFQEPTEC